MRLHRKIIEDFGKYGACFKINFTDGSSVEAPIHPTVKWLLNKYAKGKEIVYAEEDGILQVFTPLSEYVGPKLKRNETREVKSN
jgi:hypothetical protein